MSVEGPVKALIGATLCYLGNKELVDKFSIDSVPVGIPSTIPISELDSTLQLVACISPPEKRVISIPHIKYASKIIATLNKIRDETLAWFAGFIESPPGRELRAVNSCFDVLHYDETFHEFRFMDGVPFCIRIMDVYFNGDGKAYIHK